MTSPTAFKLHRHPCWLGVALALATCSMIGASAASSGAAPFATVGHPTALGRGDAVVGALPMAQPIHVEVALNMRDRGSLDALIANNAKMQSQGLAVRSMTPSEFLATHAPTQAQAQAVVDYLTNNGFTHVSIAANRLLVSADGTALTARNAFMTSFAQVRTREGRVAFANTDEVRIPALLKNSVLSVIGLQTVYQAHTFVHRVNAGSAHTNAIFGHGPLEFSAIYGATGVATGAGVTVGILTEGSLTQAKTDLNTFTSNNGLATVVTQTVNTNGTSADTSGTTEWDLDSQDIVGMAGGKVGAIVFYNIPDLFDTSLTADINAAVIANQAKIVSASIGVCETAAQGDGSAAADDTILAAGVAQGQTFSFATGDTGADECPSDGLSTPIPSWPAASQYVIAATGTTLTASTTTWSSETVWSNSGGSPSTFEPKPSWQSALVSGAHRGVADVAFDGNPNSGALIVVNGAIGEFGGTSLSAPLFAGMWARVIAVRGTGIGFAGPYIYALPAGDLHDVTSGSNGAETAGVGYDFASGRGSIILGNAINHIGAPANSPPVANFGFVTNLLAVNFTDGSTDINGNATIVSHAWTFGDGSTSTATNPTHTYAATGTYNVSETVTDNGGLANTKTSAVKVASTLQLFGNSGFETGKASPWIMSAGVLNNRTAEPAHAGVWDAWLNGKGIANAETISQQVAIPAGKTSATLGFYLHIDTAETTTTAVRDRLTVRVTNSADVVLATLATYSNLNHAPGYISLKIDMTPYLGQTVKVKFSGNENSSLQTSFVLDDITLTVR